MFEDKEYPMCFACGKKNPIGLKMTFKWIKKNVCLILPRRKNIKAITA